MSQLEGKQYLLVVVIEKISTSILSNRLNYSSCCCFGASLGYYIMLSLHRKVATETDMTYNNHYVTMHDLLRDLAILQSKGESFEQRKRLIIDLNGGNRPDW
jgi:hypothetical protein